MNVILTRQSTIIRYATIIFLTIYVFCLIYAPRFFSFNTLHILTIISFLLSPLLFKEIIYVGEKAITVKFCLTYFFIVLCSSFIAYLGGERLTLTNLVFIPIELCTCVLFTIALLKWMKLDSVQLINIILCVGIIQSLICCAMVFIPEFRSAINEFRAQFWDDRLIGWSSVRLLGFADGLFHTTPIIQAIISILLIKKAEKNYYLYIFVITTLFSALLNSRTSFIVWLLCLIYYFMSNSITRSGKKRSFIFLCCTIIILPSIIIVFNENASSAMEYFFQGMQEIDAATQGENVGFFELLNKYLTFPKGLDFLFGIGCDTYGVIIRPEYRAVHTDYGFVNDIWIYGIVGAICMIILYIKAILNCENLKNSYAYLIVGCLLISFFIGHFKGIITYYNDYTAFLILVSSSTVLDWSRSIRKVSTSCHS